VRGDRFDGDGERRDGWFEKNPGGWWEDPRPGRRKLRGLWNAQVRRGGRSGGPSVGFAPNGGENKFSFGKLEARLEKVLRWVLESLKKVYLNLNKTVKIVHRWCLKTGKSFVPPRNKENFSAAIQVEISSVFGFRINCFYFGSFSVSFISII
jgi:hypothetical protein